MPTISDVIVEIEELKNMADELQEILPNRFLDQVDVVYDVALSHSNYMKGKKFNQVRPLAKPKITKSLVNTMHNDSIKCMKKHPEDKYDKSACECVHWTSHFDQDSYTLHTHTIPKVDYPSPADIKTTNALNKSNLCIINVSDRTVTCYNKNDNFSKISSQESY